MNNRNILRLLEPKPACSFVDLGCHDGNWTLRVASALQASEIYGIDRDLGRGAIAATREVRFILADLNRPIPLSDECMDVVHANQVIEHLEDVDSFVGEISRIIRPNGYAVISTENLASIDNILALVMGQQPFSQHISRRKHIGNRFSPHYGKPMENQLSAHRTVLSYYGLTQLAEWHGLNIEAQVGAGYPPLPSKLAQVDPVHARFIAIKARKSEGR